VVDAACKVLPGFDPLPKLTFTTGSPKDPEHTCAMEASWQLTQINTIAALKKIIGFINYPKLGNFIPPLKMGYKELIDLAVFYFGNEKNRFDNLLYYGPGAVIAGNQ
jgi:hypothetical protein